MEYRFVFYPGIGVTQAIGFTGNAVSSIELAQGQLGIIADYTLHLHANNLMPDFSDMGVIEQKEDGGEWKEISEDDLDL